MTESRSIWNCDESVFIEWHTASNGPETHLSSSGAMTVKRQRKGQSCRGGSWMSRLLRRGAATCRRVPSAPSSHYISGVRRTGWTSLLCLPLRPGYNSLTWLNRTWLGRKPMRKGFNRITVMSFKARGQTCFLICLIPQINQTLSFSAETEPAVALKHELSLRGHCELDWIINPLYIMAQSPGSHDLHDRRRIWYVQ